MYGGKIKICLYSHNDTFTQLAFSHYLLHCWHESDFCIVIVKNRRAADTNYAKMTNCPSRRSRQTQRDFQGSDYFKSADILIGLLVERLQPHPAAAECRSD
jgi:hypothetical protein